MKKLGAVGTYRNAQTTNMKKIFYYAMLKKILGLKYLTE